MIQNKALIVVIVGFLLFALATPFILMDRPDNDTTRYLTVEMYYSEEVFNNATGWSYEDRVDTLTYVSSMDDLITVLKTQYYYDYPLAVDVSSWDIHEMVAIGGPIHAEVMRMTTILGHDCWECKVTEESNVFYESDTGLFVLYELFNENFSRTFMIQDMEFQRVDPSFTSEGILLAGIFAELAVIIWLFAYRLKKFK
ncbi:MAG: hypothetical protein ACFFE2_10665 [Candidatus Thorarchaeota archaeon]